MSSLQQQTAFDQAHAKLAALSPGVELPPGVSLAEYTVRRCGNREGLYKFFASLTDDQIETLAWDLDFWARPEQIPPIVFAVCFMMAGRGFGKTWAGARWVNQKAREGKTLGALIGPTAADVRDTMVEGSSGILALSPPWFRPVYEPSKVRLTWPNGVTAKCFSADKPDGLRGPNTGWVWGDEPATWRYDMAALDQVKMFNRIGTETDPPQLLLTGTPRPLKKLEELIAKPGTVLRTGSSLANRANLAPQTIREMEAIAGTRWGQQEVMGRLLMDVPGAIFSSAKWRRVDADPLVYSRSLDRRIIAVDPSPTSEEGNDESGIIPMGSKHVDGLKHVSILGDLSMRASPREWASTAIRAYVRYECEALVVEVNAGGEMVETLISTVAGEMGVHVNVVPVRATSAKSKRAEPVSALAEAGRIEFVGPITKADGTERPSQYPRLEKQLEKFTGVNGRRDDRADAMCWGAHHLVFAEQFFALF